MSISKEAVQYLFPHVFSADPAVDCVKNPCHATVCTWIFSLSPENYAGKSAHKKALNRLLIHKYLYYIILYTSLSMENEKMVVKCVEF